ncbi:MAG: transglutaminase-like domain-containing protein [Clostridia bacterium]|nr:transglutaminase-like domain-containing protein [Clostridia bacterium]
MDEFNPAGPAVNGPTEPAAPQDFASPQPPREPKKDRHVGLKILAVFMCLLILLSVAMSGVSLAFQLGAFCPTDDDYEADDVAQEDDVTIAGEFEIKSTKHISDAYISGDSSALSDRDKETLQMASDVIDDIITDEMSDVDKEAAVYEYLTRELENDAGILTVIPNTGKDSDNPYGVLKYGSAVCVGYATTFRLFMQMLGIECMVVHDSWLTHSWDLVHLDGDWYHTDCYFDSPNGSYRHFNMTDAVRAQDEEWNTEFFPAAEGTKYNFAVYNGVDVKNIYEIPQTVMDALSEGKTAMACRVTEPIENEPAASYMVEMLSGAVNYVDGFENCMLDSYWLEEDGLYTLCLFVGSNGEETDYGLTDEEMEKISDAVNEAFGTELDYDDFKYGYGDDYDEVVTSYYGYDGDGTVVAKG